MANRLKLDGTMDKDANREMLDVLLPYVDEDPLINDLDDAY